MDKNVTFDEIYLKDILDHAAVLANGSLPGTFIGPVMEYLFRLSQDVVCDVEWERISKVCRNHAIHSVCLEDPYTARSFRKPRGFSGDAELIDFFYGYNGPSLETTPRGSSLFTYFMSFPACDSVRFRRGYFARMIDDTCRRTSGGARIASIACGHFRELHFSIEAKNGNFEKIVAFDQDAKALSVIKDDPRYSSIEIVEGGIGSIIKGKAVIDDFDLIYSAGLYDYLEDKVAQALTKKLFNCLRPNGQLIFANFLPSIFERGYMRAFMDWELIYRTPESLLELTSKISSHEISNQHVFVDPLGSVVYAVLTKK